MDEWVGEDRIDDNRPVSEDELKSAGDTVDPEQPDRKITRNQKRKHDEINHVQKVRVGDNFHVLCLCKC